jgi:hypothetical protein
MNLLCKLFYSILNVLIVESVSKRKGIPTVREDNRQSKQRPFIWREFMTTHHRLKCLTIWWQEFKAAN